MSNPSSQYTAFADFICEKSKNDANIEIVSNEIASNEIASNEIASNEIASNEIVSNEIASNELVNDEITSHEYAKGEYASHEYASHEYESIAINMNEDDVTSKSSSSHSSSHCEHHPTSPSHQPPSKVIEQPRTWKYYAVQVAVLAVAFTLGSFISHYITAFVFGSVFVKSGLGVIGAKLAATKVGAKVTAAVHHFIHSRAVSGQCCCCSCSGCNGCCPCGDACCGCSC